MIRFQGIETSEFERLRDGGADANGQPPLRRRAEGLENPCRHCLQMIPEGEEKLVLAYRPFEELHPYSEVGPIFLHTTACERYDGAEPPWWFEYMQPALVRGHRKGEWIAYDRSAAVPGGEIAERCEAVLCDPEIAFVQVRSKYGCFQCRVERG